jgi:hypothetical protein
MRHREDKIYKNLDITDDRFLLLYVKKPFRKQEKSISIKSTKEVNLVECRHLSKMKECKCWLSL